MGARPLVQTNVGSTPLAHHSPSVSPRMERAGQLGPVSLVRKTSKTSVSQGSPHTKMAPTSPNSVPAHPSTVREGGRILPKKGEKWLASPVMNEINASIAKCLPSPQALLSLSIPKPVTS